MTRDMRDLCPDTSHGGAEGNRTPDLLIANETRYQLRYSPLPDLPEGTGQVSTRD